MQPPADLVTLTLGGCCCCCCCLYVAEDGAGGYVITLDFVKEMLETFKEEKLIHRRFAFQILLQVGRWCQG